MDQKNGWLRLLDTNPGHSLWYIDRFRSMAEAGADLAGEARFVDAMAGRRSRVLDAGCGPGRVGGRLAQSGHDVVGVDLDPVLIDAARREYPQSTWFIGDLAELDLPSAGIVEGFDVVVCAGNVMTFLAPDSRVEVLRRMGAHLRDGGRLVVGFGAGRGYEFADFLDDAGASGLVPDLLLSTWDLRPFDGASDFLVAVLRVAGGHQRGD
jgi:SAM-dependent methyltransferase